MVVVAILEAEGEAEVEAEVEAMHALSANRRDIGPPIVPTCSDAAGDVVVMI